MRRLILSTLLAAGALSLAGCGTFGQKVELSLADLETRCTNRGGTLQPNGRQTGEARRDHDCRGFTLASAGRASDIGRAATNQAVDRTTRGF